MWSVLASIREVCIEGYQWIERRGFRVWLVAGSLVVPSASWFLFCCSFLLVCGGRYISWNGTVISPYYPSYYPPNVDCHWIIRVGMPFFLFFFKEDNGLLFFFFAAAAAVFEGSSPYAATLLVTFATMQPKTFHQILIIFTKVDRCHSCRTRFFRSTNWSLGRQW